MPETLDEIKKYVGPFSGPQMDQIFYEILNYTSERFAKGTAGGVPVAAGTPGYNDNSLFYKNQAAAQVSLAQAAAAAAANSAQRAESAVPAGTDAAVLWTRDQSTELTADDKAVARKNIMAGGTNPNLLDNPWWGQGVVNQLGFTSYSGTSGGDIIMDRWQATYGSGGVTCSLTADGYSQAPLNASNRAIVQQKFEADTIAFLDGKVLTFSVLLSDGTLAHGTITRTNGTQQIFFNQILAGAAMRVGINASNILFIESYTTGHTIKAVKLELGSVSTLANDAAPNYAEELAKCQRYFLRIKTQTNSGYNFMAIGYTVNVTVVVVPLNIPANMRRITSVAMSGTFKAYKLDSSASYPITALTISNQAPGIATLSATVSGATAGLPVIFQSAGDVNAYIDLSARL